MAHFCDHVLQQMALRGVERDEVELVLADPERDFPARETDRHFYSRHIGGRLILVAVEPYDHEELVTVITP
jgi:hypothetical protein